MALDAAEGRMGYGSEVPDKAGSGVDESAPTGATKSAPLPQQVTPIRYRQETRLSALLLSLTIRSTIATPANQLSAYEPGGTFEAKRDKAVAFGGTLRNGSVSIGQTMAKLCTSTYSTCTPIRWASSCGSTRSIPPKNRPACAKLMRSKSCMSRRPMTMSAIWFQRYAESPADHSGGGPQQLASHTPSEGS